MIRPPLRILAFVVALACVAPALAAPPQLPAGADPKNTIVIDTTKGQVVIKLRPDVAPKAAERLKTLAREHFYDNVPFHRVIEGFMAQTGDGQKHNGTGGSKYPDLPAEFSQVPYKRGIVGMARTNDPNSANSQVLHHVQGGGQPERTVHGGRRGRFRHGRGRQDQEGRAGGQAGHDGQGAGRRRYEMIALMGGDVTNFVPAPVAARLKAKCAGKRGA
jgi:peptidylprolyl isomerase